MNVNDYQKACARTAGDVRLEILALGVAGEAGEVADIIKKHVGHGHALDRDGLLDELGDVFWYLAMLAEQVGANLEDVMAMNVQKLQRRYPDGFSADRSINR